MIRWFERDRGSLSAESEPARLVNARIAPDWTTEDDGASVLDRGVGRWSSPWTTWSASGFLGVLVYEGQVWFVGRPSRGTFVDGGAWTTGLSATMNAQFALTTEPLDAFDARAMVAWTTDARELRAAQRAQVDIGGTEDLAVLATDLRAGSAPALASSSRLRLLVWIDASGAVRARPGNYLGRFGVAFTVASEGSSSALSLSARAEGFLLVWRALSDPQSLRAMRFDAWGCPTDRQPLALARVAEGATFAATAVGEGWLAAWSAPAAHDLYGSAIGLGGEAATLAPWHVPTPLHGFDLAQGPSGTALLTYSRDDPAQGRALVLARSIEGVVPSSEPAGPCALGAGVDAGLDAGAVSDGASPDRPTLDGAVRSRDASAPTPTGRIVAACGCHAGSAKWAARGWWWMLAAATIVLRRRMVGGADPRREHSWGSKQ